MDTAGTSTAAPAEPPDNRVWGPPGVLFFLCTALAILIALDTVSRGPFGPALGMSVLAIVAWPVLAAIWLIRFLGAAWTNRLRLRAMHWLRWMAIPVVLGAVFLLSATRVPSEVRFSLSRGAMDEAAAEVMAGGSTDRGWIGLYPVERVERIANGMRFLISGSGFIDRVGLAYSNDVRPAGIDGTDAYEPLGGGWWIWVEKFN